MRVHRLSKRFGRLAALDDVSFEIRSGEVLGIIGPNGAGKTTLLECMAGVVAPDSGAVDGQDQFFYLPDAIAPWPTQTVGWALEFAVGFLGGKPEAVEAAVQDFDLASLLGQPIGTLSKGQRKRALLGVGCLTAHPVLLCDEPFDGLDLRQTRDVGGALRRRAAAGGTLVLSIHQIHDAERVCDRFVLLSAGRVCGEGTARELAARTGARAHSPDLSEVFLALT